MTTFLESHRPTANGQNPKGSTSDLTTEEIQEAIAPSQGTSNNNIEFAFWLKTQRDSLTNNRDGEKAIVSGTTRLANFPSSSGWRIIAVAYNSYARRYRESSVQVPQFMHDLMERELNAPERPSTCQGCRYYYGEVFNDTMLVCVIHPSYGWDHDDWLLSRLARLITYKL